MFYIYISLLGSIIVVGQWLLAGLSSNWNFGSGHQAVFVCLIPFFKSVRIEHSFATSWGDPEKLEKHRCPKSFTQKRVYG